MPPSMTDRRNASGAFSLVELSIVLVIIGLLAGGVLSGRSLIRASELRAATADLSRYHAAVRTFQEKYFQLPGDITNATAFWGVLAGDGTGNDAACQNAEATGLPTCNGNGDGFIAYNSVEYGERFRAWQHLANAGLIEGRYTGKTTGTINLWEYKAGANVPGGRISNAAFYIEANQVVTTNTATQLTFVGTPAGNRIQITTAQGFAGSAERIMTPQEAWNIDTKIDDGRPGLGKIFVFAPSITPNCAVNASAAAADADNRFTAVYDLSQTAKTCVNIIYLFQ